MFNKVFLIGRLGQDPEMRYTPSGTAVTNFSIATNRKWRDKQGNQQEETTWHDIVCWGKTAEFVAEYSTKGRLVFVEGEIQKRNWEDKTGTKRVSVEINARNVQLLEWPSDKPSDGKQQSSQSTSSSETETPTNEESGNTEDDVPF